MFSPREACAEETFGAVLIVRLGHALNQPDGIDQEGTDNRRVQAFVVQHQHRVIQTWPGVHHVPAGACLRRHVPEVGGDVSRPVHARKIEVAKGRHGAAVPVCRQAVYRRALQQERHNLGFVENLRDQLAVFQVIGGKRRFIFIKAPVDLVHSVPGVVDGFAFAKQLLCDRFEGE